MKFTGRGAFTENKDKLLGVKHQSANEWDMKCLSCGSKKLYLHPIGVPFQQEPSDHADLPDNIRSLYTSQKTYYEVLMDWAGGKNNIDVTVECLSCGDHVRGVKNHSGHTPIIVNYRKVKQLVETYSSGSYLSV